MTRMTVCQASNSCALISFSMFCSDTSRVCNPRVTISVAAALRSKAPEERSIRRIAVLPAESDSRLTANDSPYRESCAACVSELSKRRRAAMLSIFTAPRSSMEIKATGTWLTSVCRYWACSSRSERLARRRARTRSIAVPSSW